MNVRAFLAVAAVLGAAAALASQAADEEKSFTDTFAVDAADWSTTGANPWFPLEPGRVTEYEGKEKGATVHLTITVLAETKTIDGVETRVVEERETKNGVLEEVSRNYMAGSKRTDGVYYFGEDVDEYEDGKVAGHAGSWRSGEKGARFGLFMPGIALLGSRYYQEQAPETAMDRCEILSLSQTLETAAGKFERCLEVEETTPLEKGAERKLYAAGVGLVQDGSLKLVKVSSARR